MFANPFVTYILSFGGVLAVYQLGWSDLYPDLSPELLSFFAATFAVSALLGWLVARELRRAPEYNAGQMPLFVLWPLVACMAADLIYSPRVPLLLILSGGQFNGEEIGVPSLHVFTTTFAGGFSVIRFADFLYSKRWRFLVEAIVPVIYLALIVYRGPITMILTAWAFVVVIKSGVTFRRASVIGLCGVIGLFFFGMLGDLREGSESITKLGKPSAAFTDSGFPKTYLWTYIYMTSPTANLQFAANQHSLDTPEIAEFVVSELVPDFISKRIISMVRSPLRAGDGRIETPEVSKGLSVASLYGRAFVMFGWTGAAVMFAALSTLILVYLRLIRDSPYRAPCLALLNMFVAFCTFQNMIAFTGVVLYLVWPLFLPLLNWITVGHHQNVGGGLGAVIKPHSDRG